MCQKISFAGSCESCGLAVGRTHHREPFFLLVCLSIWWTNMHVLFLFAPVLFMPSPYGWIFQSSFNIDFYGPRTLCLSYWTRSCLDLDWTLHSRVCFIYLYIYLFVRQADPSSLVVTVRTIMRFKGTLLLVRTCLPTDVARASSLRRTPRLKLNRWRAWLFCFSRKSPTHLGLL